MGEQEKAGPLDFRKRGGVATAELLQMPLLLWREFDGILGQRSWHTDSPPDQAQVMTLPQSGRLDGGEQPQGLPDARAQRL
jgi:hypothetical protein